MKLAIAPLTQTGSIPSGAIIPYREVVVHTLAELAAGSVSIINNVHMVILYLRSSDLSFEAGRNRKGQGAGGESRAGLFYYFPFQKKV